MRMAAIFCLLPVLMNAADYTTEKTTIDGMEVYILRDALRKMEVRIAPAFGNNSYQMFVKGKDVFWTPSPTLAELAARRGFGGNPFLWPWANRIDGMTYFANGKKYLLNPELGNFRSDGHKQPIHGLLAYSKDWKVTRLSSDAAGAVVTSRLEFWQYPDLMAQFPFAHAVEMSYRLHDGGLEVETKIENRSNQPMPVSLGFHPYLRLHDSPRDEWQVHLAAQQQVKLTPTLVPSGELAPNPYPDPVTLKGVSLDDVFTGLVRDSSHRAIFTVQGKKEKIAVEYGEKYSVAVVYSPAGRDFICFEPMTGVTNAFNAAQSGWYKDLQSIPAGGTWQESYWIRPTGF